MNEALQHFTAADVALRAGDLATYQSELAAAQALVQQANDLVARGRWWDRRVAVAVRSPSASPSRLVRRGQSDSRNPRSASTSATSIWAFCRRPE